MVGLRPLVALVTFLSDDSFLIERLMLSAKDPRIYNFAVPSKIVLWHMWVIVSHSALLPKKSGQLEQTREIIGKEK